MGYMVGNLVLRGRAIPIFDVIQSDVALQTHVH